MEIAHLHGPYDVRNVLNTLKKSNESNKRFPKQEHNQQILSHPPICVAVGSAALALAVEAGADRSFRGETHHAYEEI